MSSISAPALRVASSERFLLDGEDGVFSMRQHVKRAAEARGFDRFATAAITTATSELARNVFMHGGGGVGLVEEVFDGHRFGLRVTLQDEGPGISDVSRALAGGFSTARSMGLGLSGSRRLVDDFELATTPGQGTRVVAVKWARR